MSKIDPEQERARLAARYAAMSNLELEKVGRNPAALTEWAHDALASEMRRRGLDWAGFQARPQSQPDTTPVSLSSQMETVSPEEGMIPNEPVVLRQYRDMPLALTDQMILEAAGIESCLYDENVIRLDWLWSNLLGGVKLVVRQSDFEDADQLLNHKAVEKYTVEGVGDYQQERCPRCGSDDVVCDELLKRIAGAGLLLGVPIAMTQKGWNCHACGHIWQVEGGNSSAP